MATDPIITQDSIYGFESWSTGPIAETAVSIYPSNDDKTFTAEYVYLRPTGKIYLPAIYR